MNKNNYNDLINIKYSINNILNNLDLNNISLNKSYLKKTESELLLTDTNNSHNKTICKTLYSLIIIKNKMLHCYNDKCYKQLCINKDETIYSNNEFYVKLNLNTNVIVFIDNDFKPKYTYSLFTINDVIVKENFIILVGVNNNILITNKMIYKFIEYDVIDLYDYTLFYNIKKSILIDKNGHIVDCKLNNLNIKIILDLINRFGKIENLIKCYVNENYTK